ncbi:Nitrogen permease regulator 2 [Globomyces sp. JEL0801]|nr:Nitrogen permease regulator 2 [Globomyces sp. JEL0801]
MEDLNTYHESQITINYANTIDLKLFPHHDRPPVIKDFKVPILLTDLTKYVDKHWDLGMQKILTFVDGVNSVQKISLLAGVDIKYVRLAVQHLL